MAMWNCTEFESALQQCLDARRPLSSLGLARSEIRCPHCRGLWEQFKLLEQAIVGWDGGSVEVDFSEAIVARTALDSGIPRARHAGPMPACDGAEPRSRTPHREAHRRHIPASSRRRGHAAFFAAAALVLLACLAPLFRQAEDDVAGRPREPDQRIAQEVRAREGGAGHLAPERDSLFRRPDAGPTYALLAREAETIVTGAAGVLPSAFPQGRPTGDAAIPDVDPEWMSQWQRGLKPIGDDVHQALSFLFEAVAIEDDPSI